MKKLIKSTLITAALSLGIWTLAVTFSPISSNFQAGAEVSATAFNDLFSAINDNFNAAKVAIEANETAIQTNEDAISSIKSAATASVNLTNNNSQSITNNTTVTLDWFTEAFDTGGFFDATNASRLTVAEAGIYEVSASVAWRTIDFENIEGRRAILISKSNGLPLLADSRESAGAIDTVQTASGLLPLEVGDFLEVKVIQNSGATMLIPNEAVSHFSILKVAELP